MVERYVVKWYHGGEDGSEGSTNEREYAWYLLGVMEDGTFYGEIARHYGDRMAGVRGMAGKQITTTGKLSPGDAGRFCAIARQVISEGDERPGELWTGLLAEGPPGSPSAIVRYVAGDEKTSSAAAAFLKLIAILRPYMQEFLNELKT